VAYFGGAEDVAAFDAAVRDASDEEAITAALAAWNDVLPAGAAELVSICNQHPGFADLRDALNLDFVRFNDALGGVDPPYPPLRHPERHERAMARFVEAHGQAILDRLREAYLPAALDGGDLTAYGEARSLAGLETDRAWLDLYAEPPDELVAQQVGTWLAGHGASTDLARQSELAGVSSEAAWPAVDQPIGRPRFVSGPPMAQHPMPTGCTRSPHASVRRAGKSAIWLIALFLCCPCYLREHSGPGASMVSGHDQPTGR
jgi:hypothetical protein